MFLSDILENFIPLETDKYEDPKETSKSMRQRLKDRSLDMDLLRRNFNRVVDAGYLPMTRVDSTNLLEEYGIVDLLSLRETDFIWEDWA